MTDLIQPDGIEARAQDMLARVRAMAVTTARECAVAEHVLKELRGQRQDWKAHNAKQIRSAKAAYDDARNGFKALDTPLEQAEAWLKALIGTFRLRERQGVELQAREAIASFPAAIATEGVGAGLPMLADPPMGMASSPTAGVSVGEVWKFDVYDPALVPEPFWRHEVDEAAIRAVVERTKGATVIPGVRVYLAPRVTVRK